VPAVIGLWLTIASAPLSSSDNDGVNASLLTQQEVADFQKCMFMTPSGMSRAAFSVSVFQLFGFYFVCVEVAA
jgi:hypothetical protein